MDDRSDGLRRPKSAPRVEIFTGSGRRRWDDALKARIVAESLEPGAVVTDVARRHGCRPQQVHDWRRLARQGLIDGRETATRAAQSPAQFVPLIADIGARGVSPLDNGAPPRASRERGALTIEIEGAVVHVRDQLGLALLTEVFAALRQSRVGEDRLQKGRSC